ncbi:MAG: sigma 54-dependent Fis family transcriptional regulator [Deltaproteobacteria bacterium]|nr:sigma 54-dependent Fis family transcriptional regulator [Deltaproteobacteria bacterium]
MAEMTQEFDLQGLEDEVSQRTVFISEKQDSKFLRAGRLVVVKGTDKGRELTIDKQRCLIGRSAGCSLVLNDSSVSSVHAEVCIEPEGYLLRDLKSTNGIFMLGHRALEVFLRPGSEFQVGNNLLRFEPLENLVRVPLSARDHFGRALGSSVKMREIFAVLEKAAASNLSILIRGETGTGKELLASAVHNYSLRKNRAFIVLNCAAVPANLIEDELFGHERGAFTGAERVRAGLFEEANGGTLFIDEVGELRLGLQPKLLRVLECGEVQRLGSVRPIEVDVRVVAATHRDLWAMVDEELFRRDLLYRLSVVEVIVPPLRERPEDIPVLVEHFSSDVNRVRKDLGMSEVEFDEEAMVFLQSHPWPGNVRELRNAVERAVHLAEGDRIRRVDLMGHLFGETHQPALAVDCSLPYKQAKAELLEQFERQYLVQLMEREKGNLSAASRTADLARQHLRKLCNRYGISCGRGAKSDDDDQDE